MASGTRVGDSLGPYVLREQKGKGGNGLVFVAGKEGEDEVALKALDPRHPRGSEPWKRFIREIEVQRGELADTAGLVPVLDSSEKDAAQPWFTMPIAVGVVDALGEAPLLSQVIDAVRSYATTLAAMHDRGFSHRDIKPGNLFRLRGQWCIGDLGLVEVPNAETLTGERGLGPLNFMAPEMLLHPSAARGDPADVYSLAKTLWALATGTHVPPLGPHVAGHHDWSLLSFGINDANVVMLDHLIQRSTAHEPDSRPTAKQMASELAEFMRLPHKTGPVDLSTHGKRLSALLAPVREREREAAWRITQVVELRDRMVAAARALVADLEAAELPMVQWGDGEVVMQASTHYVLTNEEMTAVQRWATGIEASYLTGLAGSNRVGTVRLQSGFYIRPTAAGRMVVGAGHVMGAHHVVWSDERLVDIGSKAAENWAAELMSALHSHLDEAVGEFAETYEHMKRD
jgi:hypothetical protein